MKTTGAIRQPAVAGLFYPADPGRLRDDVDRLIEAAPARRTGCARAVLAPHAGYPYSGRLAAASLDALAPDPSSTVLVIAPSHVDGFAFTSVFGGAAYRTPLGDVEVDTELAAAIADSAEGIRLSARGHVLHAGRGEHAVEVELPFLQRLAPGRRIVPIVMGSQNWTACVELGEAIRQCAPPDAAIVASSDLSHFYSAERAQTLDTAFIEALSTLDARTVHDAVASGACEACGAGPVAAALIACSPDRSGPFELLARSHSGDVTGDRSSVVGYAAAILGRIPEKEGE